jgi:glucose/arabinose dehydrogenase
LVAGFCEGFSLAIDPATGELHLNDIGETTWEEINRGFAGANYGWPICEGTCGNPAYVDPVYTYDHSQGWAISAGTFYRGAQFPAAYQSSYFFADFCTQWIRRMTSRGGNLTLVPNTLGRIVGLAVGPDDAL